MKLDEFFHDILQRFSTVSSVEEVTELCRFYCRQLGFDAFIYALRVPTHFSDSQLVLINGYPDSWIDHYFSQSYYDIDPVIAYCTEHIVPVQWHDLALVHPNCNERIMNEAGDFGLKAGITMPVHSPHGELGGLSFALNRSGLAAHEVTQHAMPYVQLLAGHLHEAVRRVSGLVDEPGKLSLTLREQECLRWAADGKTAWEIASLLNISERTVNFHINNAMQKLNVCNRQHAVAKAVLQGLIRPHPF